MSETALTAAELETKILRQLKESTSGSDAFPSALIYDTMNEIYEEVFNQPNKQIKIRTAEHEFTTRADNTLNGALAVGGLSIVLTDSTALLPATGRIFIDNEFIDYTANSLANTLTVAAGTIKQAHSDKTTVRILYVMPSGIDVEKVQGLNVNGLDYTEVDISQMINAYESTYRNYAVHENYLMLSAHTDTLRALLFYTPIITRMTSTTPTAIPSPIPNNFRVSLIVNGSVGKLMMLDGQRGYEQYYRPPANKGDKGGGLFYNALRMFYANYGRQTDIRNKRTSKSIYD